MSPDAADPIEILRATPLQIASVLQASRLGTSAAADEGENARPLIAAMADREIRFAFDVRQAVAATYRPEEGPYRSQPVDEVAWARDYERLDAALAAEAFLALRAWNLAWLARLDLADWWAPCVDPHGSGDETIDERVRAHAEHDVACLAQLRTLVGD